MIRMIKENKAIALLAMFLGIVILMQVASMSKLSAAAASDIEVKSDPPPLPPLKDIIVTGLTLSKPPSGVRVNEEVVISVEVFNHDNIEYTFEVVAEYTFQKDPLIGTETVTVMPQEWKTTTFRWTPNAIGRYEVTARASLIPGDINPENNIKTIVVYAYGNSPEIRYYGPSRVPCPIPPDTTPKP